MRAEHKLHARMLNFEAHAPLEARISMEHPRSTPRDVRARDVALAAEETQPLEKYRAIAELGRGGMADVYLAVMQGAVGFNKLVVIKKTRAELADEPGFLRMFLDEARLAARLNHPNVVQTHEVGEDGDRYFIVMEYLDGQPLNRIRAAGGEGFTLAMQVRVLVDVLAGLHHAHDLCDFDGTPLGVVHRDVTPHNVFVTYDGSVKVVDFGIAKAADSSHETRTGVVKGKVTYMAPEQARGAPIDRRADVFAVGVMLFEALAGTRMWKGLPELAVVHALTTGKVPDVRAAAPDAPEDLLAVCERALAPDRDRRFPDAQVMLDELERWLGRSSDRATTREVGRFVGQTFSEERARIKSLIETQLRDVRWSGAFPRITSLSLPKIQVPVSSTPRPLELVVDDGASNALTVAPSRASGQAELPTTAGSVTSVVPTQPAPRGRRNLLAMGALASVVVALGGALVAALWRSSAPSIHESTATVTTSASTTSVETTRPETVKLTIHVSPSDARVLLDGNPIATGSYEGRAPREPKEHRVRVEAQRYVARETTVSFDADAIVDVSLEREDALPTRPPANAALARPRGRAEDTAPPKHEEPAPAPPPQPQPVSPPTTTPAPVATATGLAPGQKPKRPIETDSPYAQ